MDNQVQPLPIEEFLKSDHVLVDAYLRISATKFILLVKEGTETPRDVLEKYQQRKVGQLYVWLEDYRRILETQLKHLGKDTPAETLGRRFAVVRDAIKAVYDDIRDLGFDEAQFNQTKLINHATMTFINENPSLANLLDRMTTFTKDSVRHSLMVSVISVMVGQKLEWEKPGTLEKLGLGGFLHDIGKLKTPLEIAEKHQSTMNRDERVIYQNHAGLGAEMAAAAKNVPDDVMLIIREHHERADGTGFPDGLKDFQTSPFARVVLLANAFVDQIEAEGRPFTAELTHRLYDDFKEARASQFNRDAVRALGKCLTIPNLKVAG